MKNIMLLGITRSGKSTFAELLHNKYNYNIIHGDMIKASYQKNIKNISGTELKESKEYRNFIKNIFKNEIKYNNMNYAIDTVDIFPSDITEEEKENYSIFFFGYPNIEVNELVNIWKKTDLEFTKKFTKKELIEKAQRGIENSKRIMEECQKYKLTFIDTTYNRENIFNQLLNEIRIDK